MEWNEQKHKLCNSHRIQFLKNFKNFRKQQKSTWPLVWWWVLTHNKKANLPNCKYKLFKTLIFTIYTFTLWRTLFERTKGQTVEWIPDNPSLPSNREEKTLSGVILQKEVLVRNKVLTSYHQPGFWRDQRETGDSSTEVLPASQDPPCWNASRLSDACAPRKDANSEWLASDKPERNPMTIKPETIRFSPFPSGRAVLSISLTLLPPDSLPLPGAPHSWRAHRCGPSPGAPAGERPASYELPVRSSAQPLPGQAHGSLLLPPGETPETLADPPHRDNPSFLSADPSII